MESDGSGMDESPSLRRNRSRLKNTAPSEETLFDNIKSGKNIAEVTAGWVNRYKDDRDTALMEIIQFFLTSTGSGGVVTPEQYQQVSDGFQDLLQAGAAELPPKSATDYPLITNMGKQRQFKLSLGNFIEELINQLVVSELLYDQFMMEYVIQLLIEMSPSKIRAFRHTGTFSSMKLGSKLVGVSVDVNQELQETNHHYNTESEKCEEEQSVDVMDMLSRRKDELDERQQEIETFLNSVFKDVFLLRYRDTSDDIRAVCMEELAIWIYTSPNVFGDNESYVKYIGWMLNDSSAIVRRTCLESLCKMARKKDLRERLSLFFCRFKARLVAMKGDVDNSCAVSAIHTLTNILANNTEMAVQLTPAECEQISSLVFHTHRPIAIAAGEFLSEYLLHLSRDDDGALQDTFTSRGERITPNASRFISLIDFYKRVDINKHTTYLVDALWDVQPDLMLDWSGMTQVLLDHNSELNEEQETALIDLLLRSVAQTATGLPHGRSGTRKVLGAKDKQRQIENREALTEQLMEPLPKLYSKFGSDRAKAPLLLQIPRYFDLKVFAANRSETNLEELLHELTQILEKHSVEDIMEEVAETMAFFVNTDESICTKAHSTVAKLVDQLHRNFVQGAEFLMTEGNQFDVGDTAALRNRAQRLASLAAQNDLTHKDISGVAIRLLKARVVSSSEGIRHQILLDPGLTCALLKMILTDSAWLRHNQNDHHTVETEEALVSIGKELLTLCGTALKSKWTEVQDVAYSVACDALLLYSNDLDQEDLVFHRLIRFLVEYIKERIMLPAITGEEEESYNLIWRRQHLAAFCRLFAKGIIDVKYGAVVFEHYLACYEAYGDIIKEAISKARATDQISSSKTLLLAMRNKYEELFIERDGELLQEDFYMLKDIARRFALTFGFDNVKRRTGVAAMHHDGIDFAMKVHSDEDHPRHISFLEVIGELSHKLIKQDRTALISYLEGHFKRCQNMPDEHGWMDSYLTYRTTLEEGKTNRRANVSRAQTIQKKNPSRKKPSPKPFTESTTTSTSKLNETPIAPETQTSRRRSNSCSSQDSLSSVGSTDCQPGFAESTRLATGRDDESNLTASSHSKSKTTDSTSNSQSNKRKLRPSHPLPGSTPAWQRRPPTKYKSKLPSYAEDPKDEEDATSSARSDSPETALDDITCEESDVESDEYTEPPAQKRAKSYGERCHETDEYLKSRQEDAHRRYAEESSLTVKQDQQMIDELHTEIGAKESDEIVIPQTGRRALPESETDFSDSDTIIPREVTTQEESDQSDEEMANEVYEQENTSHPDSGDEEFTRPRTPSSSLRRLSLEPVQKRREVIDDMQDSVSDQSDTPVDSEHQLLSTESEDAEQRTRAEQSALHKRYVELKEKRRSQKSATSKSDVRSSDIRQDSVPESLSESELSVADSVLDGYSMDEDTGTHSGVIRAANPSSMEATVSTDGNKVDTTDNTADIQSDNQSEVGIDQEDTESDNSVRSRHEQPRGTAEGRTNFRKVQSPSSTPMEEAPSMQYNTDGEGGILNASLHIAGDVSTSQTRGRTSTMSTLNLAPGQAKLDDETDYTTEANTTEYTTDEDKENRPETPSMHSGMLTTDASAGSNVANYTSSIDRSISRTKWRE